MKEDKKWDLIISVQKQRETLIEAGVKRIAALKDGED